MGNDIQWCKIIRILQAESGSNILITYFDKKKNQYYYRLRYSPMAIWNQIQSTIEMYFLFL